jgi:arsenical pump membrane protein
LHWLSLLVEERAGNKTELFLGLIFILSVVTAGVLNNDSAILVLTPLVIRLVQRRYPQSPKVWLIFAFTVFMGAGVAPFIVSNPINMIVASYANIGFNQYAARMIPVAILGWLISFLILRLYFRKDLKGVKPHQYPPHKVKKQPGCNTMLLLLFTVLFTYPLASLMDFPIWLVASAGAITAIFLGFRHQLFRSLTPVYKAISWDILGFMFGVYLLSIGLRQVGVVPQMGRLYNEIGLIGIGFFSSFASALINNHPMAMLNMLAIGDLPEATSKHYLAALIGGDLGPRLLPMGSLAGLLWLECLRRFSIPIKLRQFVTLGILVTLPTLLGSLCLLWYL